MQRIRVLFVCLGNICRSPLAEAIFKHKVKARGWDHLLEADSCGTGNYHIGSQPDPRTIANARKNQVPIDHCARQLAPADLDDFDYILAMDANNFSDIMRLPNAARYEEKIRLMRDYDPRLKGAEVPDPYFGGEEGFQNVFEILDQVMEKFLDNLQYEHSLKTDNS